MGRLVVRLKTIKYNKDSFCYLSSYTTNLGFQAPCLLTLFFRPYAFKTLYPWQNTFVHPNLRFQIHSNNWTPICWVYYWPNGQFLIVIGLIKHQEAILAASSKLCILPPVWWFQRPKVLCRSKMFSYNHASYWLRLKLAIRWPSH